MRYRLLPFALILIGGAALADPSFELRGVEGELATNVRNHIGSISENELQQPRLLRQKLKNDIPQAMRALGHYESHFEFSRKGDTVQITIEPGPAVTWGEPQIEVKGSAANIRTVHQLLKKPPFKEGDVINHQTYENYKRDLLEQCQEFGFLDARIEQSHLRIDLEQRRATAILIIQSGARYRVAALDFSGSKLNQDLLRRLARPVRPGVFYRKSDLTELQRNLQSSSYFRDIDVQTDKLDNENVVISAKLSDAPSHQVSVGAGYGTDTGPRAKLRWEQPHATQSGHRVITELSISQPQQDLTVEYRIPLQKPIYDSLSLTTAWQHRAVEDTASTVGSVGFYFSKRRKDWFLNYGATYDDESYRQGSEPRRRVRYLLPGANATEMVVAPGIDPTWGHKTWIAATFSAPPIGADSTFLRSVAGYKRIIDIGHSQLLIPRVELGALATNGSIEQIPASQRFFTGGDNTVRGYDFESLGPRDASGQLIGGRYLNVASLEYSFKILPQWRLAVFSDTGRAFNRLGEPWHYSAGVGVRWLSPVGQIRVDLAFPINEEDKSWRVHIFMGPPL